MGKEGTRPEPSRAPEHAEQREREDDPWFRCAACGHGLAPEHAAIAQGGSHRHTFVNPAGHEFTIRCFSEAPGARPLGEESTFWTWFPGFAWRLGACAACGAHVGWSFRSGGGGFWGLIVSVASSSTSDRK
jgi:hypothetical protein